MPLKMKRTVYSVYQSYWRYTQLYSKSDVFTSDSLNHSLKILVKIKVFLIQNPMSNDQIDNRKDRTEIWQESLFHLVVFKTNHFEQQFNRPLDFIWLPKMIGTVVGPVAPLSNVLNNCGGMSSRLPHVLMAHTSKLPPSMQYSEHMGPVGCESYIC